MVAVGGDTYLSGVNLTIDPTSNWNVSGLTLDNGAQVFNYGHATWMTNDVAIDNGSSIINLGDFNIACDQIMTSIGGGDFWNAGTLEKTVSAANASTEIQTLFDSRPYHGMGQNASVTVQQGTLLLDGGGEESTPFTVNADATLTLSGIGGAQKTFQLDGILVTGAGTFDVDLDAIAEANAALVTIQTATLLLQNGGVLDGTPPPGGQGMGTFDISSAVTWRDGAAITDTVVQMTNQTGGLSLGGLVSPVQLTDSQLLLFGPTTWSGTWDIGMTNSTITNYGVFTVATRHNIIDGNPPAAPPGQQLPPPTSFFINDGSFVKQAGTLPNEIQVPFLNYGRLSFNGGGITFDSIVQQLDAGAVTDLGGGTMTLTGAKWPTTVFQVFAGEVTGAAGATINGDLWNSGAVDFGVAFGALTITGNYTQTAGGTLTNNIGSEGSDDTLQISGAATQGGALQINGSQGEAQDILHVGGVVTNTFADVSDPWTVFLYDGDVWVR